MCANANEERKKRHPTKANGQLCRIPRARPLDAKQPILLLAAVADALWKVAAFERGEDLLPLAGRVDGGYPHHLAFATFHEAIMDDGAAVYEFTPWVC
jgi:hypothetical protein